MYRVLILVLVIAAICGLLSSVAYSESTLRLAFLHGGDPYIVRRDVVEPSLEAALKLLLEGPSSEEAAMGIVSAIPKGWSLSSVTIDGEYAVINLSGVAPGTCLGDATVDDIIAQFMWTTRQFGLEARVLVDGNPISVLRPNLPPAPRRPIVQFPGPVGVGPLSGKKICIRPGHGYKWNGSSWTTDRPVYCSPLSNEDFHNVDHAILLKWYLEQEGATVIDTREMNKNRGNSPYGGKPWWQLCSGPYAYDKGYPAAVYAPYTLVPPGTPGIDQSEESRRVSCEMSDYDGADVYISLHTNGLSGDCYGAGCPTGIEMYYDSTKQGGNAAQSQIIADRCEEGCAWGVNTYFDPTFACRNNCNPRDYAFTECHYPDALAILLEFGFHDTCDRDALFMRDPLFTSAGMYGVCKGICNYFGTTPSYDGYSSEYVSNDIPDTVMRGEIRTVHITMLNRGVAWAESHGFRLGAVGDSDPFAVSNRATISGNVLPGSMYTFSIQMRFGTEGTYTTDWRMVRDGVTWFGPTFSKDVTVTPSTDTVPPSVPQNLRITGRRVAGVDLAWDPSTDNVAVWGYRILRNGVEVGTTTGTTYTDTGLTSGVTYEWRVEAFDVVPNYSGPSAPVSGSGCVPLNLRVTDVTYHSVSLAWDISPGAVGVVGYRIWRDGVVVGSTSGTTYTDDPPLAPDTSYNYQVDAYDNVPNYSIKSNTVTAHTLLQDVDPPTVPQNVRTSAVTRSTVRIDWDHSTDNFGVAGYRLYRNGQVIASLSVPGYVDSDLDPGTTYTYEVDAFDALLNYSAKSAPALATTNSTGVFLDGFDGSLSNWILESGTAFQYSTAQNHGVLPGAGSAYGSTGSGHLMYHWLDPKQSTTEGGYPTGIYEGWLYDTQGAVSGMRTGLRLYAYDSNGTKKAEYWIGTYNATAFPTRYMAAVWAGAWTYYDLGVTRSVAWHKLGIEVLPYTGSNDLRFHVDGAVRATLSQPAAAANTVLRRACIGYYLNVNADHYFDDISFDSAVPAAPSGLSGTLTSSSSIRWTFSDNANNEIGFRIYNGGTKVAEREVMNATYIDETGIPPNTICTRTVKAYAGVLESEASAPATVCTPSVAPTTSNISADPAPQTWTSGQFRFTSLVPFGPGGVQYYRYVFDQNPTHIWTGTENVWNSGTLAVSAQANGTNWFLHLCGYNACDSPNGTLDLGPFYFNSSLKAKELADGAALKLSGKVVSAAYSGAFYVIELDRVSGIKVVSTTPVQIGDIVNVTGTIQTADGERYIQATNVEVY